MNPKIILEIIKLLLSGKKGRKIIRNLVIAIVVLMAVAAAAVSGSGLQPTSNVSQILGDIWDSIISILNPGGTSRETWSEKVTATELIEAMESSGYTLTAEQERQMRLAPGNFEYLLRKVDNYDKNAKMKRKVTVQGLHEYIEIVTTDGTDADGQPVSETTIEDREEYVYQEIEVSNQEIEGLYQLDWRLLYIYSLMTAIGRREQEAGGTVVAGNSWLVQQADIDKAFDALAMKYDYAFDVMRSPNSSYQYEACQQLPHVMWTEGNPDTEAGRYTYYYPRSLLNYGMSGYSAMAHTQEGGMVTGVEEVFSLSNFARTGNNLCRYYSYKYLSTLLKRISGGRAILESFDWYILQARSGNSVMRSNVYQINPGAYKITEDGRYTIGGEINPALPDFTEGNGSVGSAAVQIALSRLDWRYSQALRYEIGYWDCSSMISRIYHELNVDIPIASTTSSLLNAAYQNNQVITFEQLKPGDVLFFQTEEGVENNNPQGVGHVVMYAGGGMIVHAASLKSGTVYQALSSYYNYPDGLIVCARPYTNIRNGYIPPAGNATDTQANEIGGLSDAEAAARILEMARDDAKRSRILPSITAAQIILESGYCRSELTRKSNNCFGMKTELSNNDWPNSTWDGVSVCVMNTKEQDANGKEYTISASFRKYPSLEESIGDHSAYLLGAKKGNGLRYSGLTSAGNYREAATIIKNGGYATDVNYVDKLCRLIVQYGLDKYDSYLPNEVPAGSGKLIAIDAGHQQKGNSDLEPLGPGSNKMKAKVSSGTTGVSSGTEEYIVNLQISKLLETELKARGYRVYMIRNSHDVDISNSERALFAQQAGADILVRIHCNSVSDSKVKGALTMCQTKDNPWVADTYQESRSLSECIIKGLCDATGAVNKGVQETDEMTGINWCSMPVTIVETGFMSNSDEDQALNQTDYQKKIAKGIADGIDTFWKER